MNHLRNILRDVKLRNKILISFLLIIVTSILISASLFFWKTSEILTEQAVEGSHKSVSQAAEFINYKLTNAKNVSSLIYLDEEIPILLKKMKEGKNSYDSYETYNSVIRRLNTISMGHDVHFTRIYVKDLPFKGSNSQKLLDESDISSEEWYQDVLGGNGSIVWIPTYKYDYRYPIEEKKVISIARSINYNKPGNPVGVAIVDILENTISQILEQVNATKNGKVYLIDEDGKIISSLDKANLGKSINPMIEKGNVLGEDSKKDLNLLNMDQSIIYEKHVKKSSWKVVAILPIKEIMKEQVKLLQFMMLILLLIIAFTVFAAFKIADNITKRVKVLADNMERIKDDDWDIVLDINSSDEIGDLQRSFAYMVENMQILISEKYQSEIDIKSAELRALQSQINPHFLYNILDMINWYALKYGVTDISYIVARLAKFFRLSLSKGREMVTIRDEIEHIQLYLDIQQKRFDNSVSVIQNIDENILDYYTLKLILQPLIENAYLHGILEKEEKKGVIIINAYESGDVIIIEIIDDGVGISKKELESLLDKEKQTGYGVKNVHERLQLKYGKEFGLSYESVEDQGTKAIVIIPIITKY